MFNSFFSKLQDVLVPAALAVLGLAQEPSIAAMLAPFPWFAPAVAILAALAHAGDHKLNPR